MTYFVKAYGYNENGTTGHFNCVFDLDEVNAKTFIDAVEKAGNLSPFRRRKEIIIEEVVIISKG